MNMLMESIIKNTVLSETFCSCSQIIKVGRTNWWWQSSSSDKFKTWNNSYCQIQSLKIMTYNFKFMSHTASMWATGSQTIYMEALWLPRHWFSLPCEHLSPLYFNSTQVSAITIALQLISCSEVRMLNYS